MRALVGTVLFVGLVGIGCSAEENSGDTDGSGGARTVGGSQGMTSGSGGSSGGSKNAGGSPSTGGGSPEQGGSPSVTGGAAGQGGAPPTSTDAGAHVMTWVPTYYVQESKDRLSEDFDGVSMADGLSFLGLQFWLADGATTRLDKEGDIAWFRDWGRKHGVKVLLCVHNNDGSWNWPLALRSFKDNRAAFTAHLLDEVKTRDLDGVDVDLEGLVEASQEDTDTFLAFVKGLADALHLQGKVITVDSFHGKWNAPNWNWWPSLLPIVDGITSMGYEQSGLNVDYEELVAHASVAPEKLMIGVPSYHGNWQGNSVTEQLNWIVEQGKIGTSIWDASLRAPEWRERAVWETLKTIKSR